jgi:leader peptidase (prepilin peptidase)/N-methyltransferase
MIAFLQQNNVFFLTMIGILGLIMGSFLNVVIYRLPIMLERSWYSQSSELLGLVQVTHLQEKSRLNLFLPRSHCPKCQHPIHFLDNVPLISFLLLTGKCRYCRLKIGWRYLVVEILAALMGMLVAWRFGVSFETLAGLIFTWGLLCLVFIDLKHQLLPDVITLPLLWLGLLCSLYLSITDVQNAILGACVGYSSLWLLNQTYQFFMKTPGMGHGDFKLFAALGAWLGLASLPFIILSASILGICVGIALMMLRGNKLQTPIPFGPCLALAGWIVLLFGPMFSVWF